MAKGGAKILFGLFFFIAIAGGLAGAGAWYFTETRPAGYRATAMLLLEPTTQPASAPASGDPLRARIESALGIEGHRTADAGIAAPDYATLFQSDDTASQLKAKLEPVYAEKGLATPSVESVRASMKAEATVAHQSAGHAAYDRVIQLHFTAPDPEAAATGANAWAELCASQAAALAEQRKASREAPLAQELDAARGLLAEAADRQAILRSESHLETLEAAAVQGGQALQEFQETIRRLGAAAARDEAALAALKAYLSKAPVAVALELAVKEADAEAALAGAKAENEYASAKLAEAQAAQAEAQAKWAEASRRHEESDTEVARLTLEVEHLENALRDARFGSSSVTVAAPAVAPESPAGPHRYVVVAGAAILGAIAGMILYFGLLTLRVYARELDRS